MRLVRWSEISKENNARANDNRYNEQRNEIFLPGWPERNLCHGMRVYGLCAFNQRVSIFLDCPTERKDCSITTLKEKTRGNSIPAATKLSRNVAEVAEFSIQPAGVNFSHISVALVAWDLSAPQPPILGHNLFKCE